MTTGPELHTAIPPHAPEAGYSRRLLGRFHVTGVFWYRFHRWGVSILPDRRAGDIDFACRVDEVDSAGASTPESRAECTNV